MINIALSQHCAACGGMLVPPMMVAPLRVPRADYVCLKCGRAYQWNREQPPRLTQVTSAASAARLSFSDT
jgi:hypothetical protein